VRQYGQTILAALMALKLRAMVVIPELACGIEAQT
jgi:hypothetical protein